MVERGAAGVPAARPVLTARLRPNSSARGAVEAPSTAEICWTDALRKRPCSSRIVAAGDTIYTE